MKNILYIALIFLSVSAWATQVTLKVVDQSGSEIALSTITVTGYGTFNTGSSVDLPEGNYTGGVQPGFMNVKTGYQGDLGRSVSFSVGTSTDSISFEWITSTFSINIVDQWSVPIPLSMVDVYGVDVWAGDDITLPITDDSVYLNMYGAFKNGYGAGLKPGRNGHAGHGELGRGEALEVMESQPDITFEWITSTFKFDVVDQWGVTIPNSKVGLWGGGFEMNVGEMVTLPITDSSVYPNMAGMWSDGYDISVGPGLNGSPGYNYVMRTEIVEIIESQSDITFEWITSTFTIDVVDQNGIPIQGSKFMLADPYVEGDKYVTLPITDESVYPTMYCRYKDGYPFNIFPGLNGSAGGPPLYRGETIDVVQAQPDLNFEWLQKECAVSVVNGNEQVIQGSFITLPGNTNANNGETIHLPITDESRYPTLAGAWKDGYSIGLSPGGISVGTAIFEVTGALEFSPSFVTLGGNQYGLRCVSPPVSVTLRLVDQNGMDIPGSILRIGNYDPLASDWIRTGTTISIEPGTYPIVLAPGLGGVSYHFGLRRVAQVVITPATTDLAIEWITRTVTTYVLDQNGNASGYSSWYEFYAPNLSGQSVGLPITDESVYPNMQGNWINGLGLTIGPTANGGIVYWGQLYRPLYKSGVIFEILPGMDTSLYYEWKTVQTTILIKDQYGDIIPASQFLTEGYAWIPSGQTVRLPITDESVYPDIAGAYKDGLGMTIVPGVNGNGLHYYALCRGELVEIYEGMPPPSFEWITVRTTVFVKDQFGNVVPGSGFAGYPVGGGSSGDSVTLPITDESVYPNMVGWWVTGFSFSIYPAINGDPIYWYTDLSRPETLEVFTGMEPGQFTWDYLSCNISLVDSNGQDIPSSSIIVIPQYGYQFSSGDLVTLPVTDVNVYPALRGKYKDGLPYHLFPGGSYVGVDTFKITGSLEFDPPFVTLGGNKYGLRCISPGGSVTGKVIADCPAANTGLQGVRVDAFALGTGDLVASTLTDANGNYVIEELPSGGYTITVLTPLGYTASSDEIVVNVIGGSSVVADFNLSCIQIVANPRTIGFWKHQVGVATGGKGTAQVSSSDLCVFLDLIEVHFNSNLINQVIVYQPPSSGVCNDKLQVAKVLLNLKGSSAMKDRAKQQLMALLLNIAAGYISQTEVISADGASVSQAITYCDNVIDDPSGEYETAKTVADLINNNKQVIAGVIPLSTPDILYKPSLGGTGKVPEEYSLGQNYPNPFNPSTLIEYALPTDAYVTLKVYDVLGREVVILVQGYQTAGYRTVVLNGEKMPSGLYVYRLTAGTFNEVRRMLLMK
jgi:hypothetical protein